MSYRYQYWDQHIRLCDTQIDSILENRDMELAAFHQAKMTRVTAAKRPRIGKQASADATANLLTKLKQLTPDKLQRLRLLIKAAEHGSAQP